MKKIKYNYQWFHGGVMCNKHTDLYNKYSQEIKEIETTGFNKHRLESIKNSRHQLVQFYNPSL